MDIITVGDYKKSYKLFEKNELINPKEFKDFKTKIIPKLKESIKGLGVGLAAPQLGINKKLFVFHDKFVWKVIVNPEIIEYSENKDIDVESCLSIPYVYCEVERSIEIKVRYFDINSMRQVTMKLSGMLARRFQHEYDHLSGRLITDIAKNIRSNKTDNVIINYNSSYKED